MSGASVSHAEKVTSRSTFADWEVRCEEFERTSRNLCEKSFEKRRESTQSRLETAVQTRWDAYHNEDKLSDRVWLVGEWHTSLQRCLSLVSREEVSLAAVKRQLEGVLQSLALPLEVAAVCVSLRDARQGAELTRDQVGVELQEELRVLERHKARLVQLSAEAWQTRDKLATTHEALHLALTEQRAALDIDVAALSLTEKSPGLALRPEPRRLAPQSSVPASWLSHCQSLAERQVADCRESCSLRGTMQAAVESARNAARAQQEASQRAFRERSFQIQRAIEELEWQRRQVLEEMARAQAEMSLLRESERALEPPRQLCETRHESRTARPGGAERCQDEPQDGLANQSRRLEEAHGCVWQNIQLARTAYSSLRSQLSRLELDIQDKQSALALEARCLSTREQLEERPSIELAESHSAQL